jgi:formylglycine-generating enzyme required for sulfatase activity
MERQNRMICENDGPAAGISPPQSAKVGLEDLIFVGSKPKGKGRWDHFDLQGNVSEWNLDAQGDLVVPCDDCITRNTAANRRFTSGGSFDDLATQLDNALVSGNVDLVEENWQGVRCAFDVR